MLCPKCKSEMKKVKYQSIEIDICTGCNGIWFDMLEHEELKAIKGSEIIDLGDPKIGKEYNKIYKINCPRCNTPMIPMVDKTQPHIWYESCGSCFGIFFDAGEFTDFKQENIIDYFRDIFAKERT